MMLFVHWPWQHSWMPNSRFIFVMEFGTNDWMVHYRQLNSTFFTNTMYVMAKAKSTHGNTCAQLSVLDKALLVGYLMCDTKSYLNLLKIFANHIQASMKVCMWCTLNSNQTRSLWLLVTNWNNSTSLGSQYTMGKPSWVVCWSSEGSHTKRYAGDKFSVSLMGLLPGTPCLDLSSYVKEIVPIEWYEPTHGYVWDGGWYLAPLPIWLVWMGVLLGSVGILFFP